jgi:hypothetical protein
LDAGGDPIPTCTAVIDEPWDDNEETLAMGLLSLFRRQPPIRDGESLGRFIDEQAAFLVQKGMYEYSRARAGHYAKVLFAEDTFIAAIEQSRWRAYPLGLMMVGEMVEGVLRPDAVDARRPALDALVAVVLAVFDRYPVPAALGAAAWHDARRDVADALSRVGARAPRAVRDIPEPFAERYFAMMPIHEKLHGGDLPTTRNYLKVTLCNIHAEFTDRLAAPPATLLLGDAAET